MYLCISILSRLTLEKGVIIFCVAHTFTVIAGRGCVLRVQGYRLIVPAFRGIMAWLLTDLAKFVSVVVVGGILAFFPLYFLHAIMVWPGSPQYPHLSRGCC